MMYSIVALYFNSGDQLYRKSKFNFIYTSNDCPKIVRIKFDSILTSDLGWGEAIFHSIFILLKKFAELRYLGKSDWLLKTVDFGSYRSIIIDHNNPGLKDLDFIS